MIDKKTVAKIAHLARIEVTPQDQEHFAREISGILQWVEQLNEVDTNGVEPLSSVSNVGLPMREDKITDGNQQEAVLANAPKSEYGCFAVPKVIE